MSNLLKYTIGFLLVGLVVFGCRKEQPEITSLEENCDCANEVTADFEILESFNHLEDIYVETDTILRSRFVRFKALLEDADYTWYLGAEILNEKVIERFFNDQLGGQTIDVSLVVKKEPNLVCFPNDDGYDSISKSFFVNEIQTTTDNDVLVGSLEGNYKVYSPDLNDSIIVGFDINKNNIGDWFFNVSNYDGLGNDSYQTSSIWRLSYRKAQAVTGSAADPNFAKGTVENRIDGTAILTIITGSNDVLHPSYKEVVYKGRKI